jgi:hypothetical protein
VGGGERGLGGNNCEKFLYERSSIKVNIVAVVFHCEDLEMK